MISLNIFNIYISSTKRAVMSFQIEIDRQPSLETLISKQILINQKLLDKICKCSNNGRKMKLMFGIQLGLNNSYQEILVDILPICNRLCHLVDLHQINKLPKICLLPRVPHEDCLDCQLAVGLLLKTQLFKNNWACLYLMNICLVFSYYNTIIHNMIKRIIKSAVQLTHHSISNVPRMGLPLRTSFSSGPNKKDDDNKNNQNGKNRDPNNNNNKNSQNMKDILNKLQKALSDLVVRKQIAAEMDGDAEQLRSKILKDDWEFKSANHLKKIIKQYEVQIFLNTHETFKDPYAFTLFIRRCSDQEISAYGQAAQGNNQNNPNKQKQTGSGNKSVNEDRQWIVLDYLKIDDRKCLLASIKKVPTLVEDIQIRKQQIIWEYYNGYNGVYCYQNQQVFDAVSQFVSDYLQIDVDYILKNILSPSLMVQNQKRKMEWLNDFVHFC